MYRYDSIDAQMVQERADQFRDQVRRRLTGELSEEQFRPLRLQNGLYLQRHAYMLRVAIPYGLLSSAQVRMLAHIARTYDKGYGHISTRQNIQYNWPELERVPDILDDLASVEMHAIQTSGNCIRNVTADHLAGVAADEIVDPRPYAELLRQWSTFHPEFAFLPRKFKIAITGAAHDRAAVAFHDIGLRVVRGEGGAIGFRVIVGGGLGRTPVIGQEVRAWLPEHDLLAYCEAILRVYNQQGDRKNKYRARIKILVKTLGVDAFRAAVEAEFERIQHTGLQIAPPELDHMRQFFAPPAYGDEAPAPPEADPDLDPDFRRWLRYNTAPHRVPGYRVAYVSLKSPGRPPGDVTAEELDALANLAERFSFDELRTTHTQNIVLADVRERDLATVWRRLRAHDLAHPNIGSLTDMICCPGLDFCSLANASSIDVAEKLNETFDQLDYLYDLGELQLKMSGCVNACGHHHVGHIGILGIDKKGVEVYQIQLGGSADDTPSLGKVLGRSFEKHEIADALRRVVERYVAERDSEDERFLDTYRRVGATPFKEAAYGA